MHRCALSPPPLRTNAKRTDQFCETNGLFWPGRDRFFSFLFRRCLGTALKIREQGRSTCEDVSRIFLPTTTMMMPTNFLLCCRLAESCAGGTLFGHMVGPPLSLLLSLSFSLSLHALLHPLEALHLPRPKLFTSSLFPLSLLFLFFCFFFFSPMPSLFLGRSRGTSFAVADLVTLVTLGRHRGTRYFLVGR